MAGPAPGLVIALASPKPGGGGGEGQETDESTQQAIEDATKAFFEAGKEGDYKKAADLLDMIGDMKLARRGKK
jgi:hypothetical protein